MIEDANSVARVETKVTTATAKTPQRVAELPSELVAEPAASPKSTTGWLIATIVAVVVVVALIWIGAATGVTKSVAAHVGWFLTDLAPLAPFGAFSGAFVAIAASLIAYFTLTHRRTADRQALDQRRTADAAALKQREAAERRAAWWARVQYGISLIAGNRDDVGQATGIIMLTRLLEDSTATAEDGEFLGAIFAELLAEVNESALASRASMVPSSRDRTRIVISPRGGRPGGTHTYLRRLERRGKRRSSREGQR